MIDYREALGLGFSDSKKIEALKNLFFSTYSILSDAISLAKNHPHWNPSTDFTAYYRAICETPIQGDYKDLSPVFQSIYASRNIPEIVFKYVAFINTLDTCLTDFSEYEKIKAFVESELPKHLEATGISYSKVTDKEGIFIFPKGAKELDDALVSEPLEWLSDYPKARTAWVKALQEYSDQTDENASEIADKFRKALETFFREFFSVDKSLENCKKEYGSFLKKHGVPAEISGNFETLLQAYTNYMNGFAKHQDKTSRNVLEYLMYQTGNIIRLLITLKQEEEA